MGTDAKKPKECSVIQLKVENRGLLSWAKYQRKRIKAGALDEEKSRLFLELLDSRSNEHTGGRRRKA